MSRRSQPKKSMNGCVEAGHPADTALGRAHISAGKVGCIVLAGGDGSRLGWKGPKGAFPLFKGKTLFQFLVDQVEAASRSFGRPLAVAVMTSPLNRAQTRVALPEQFALFDQTMAPLLDENKQPLHERRPNGNGVVFRCFHLSGLYEKWRRAGIEHVQVISIDNPLAEAFDPNQVGIHIKRGCEVSLKAVEKLQPSEKVGAVGWVDGEVRIVEYSDDPPAGWELANTGLYCFSMSFIDRVKEIALPERLVKKVVDGRSVYKAESFIFDLLSHTAAAQVILCDRAQTFAPLKEPGDVASLQQAFLTHLR